MVERLGEMRKWRRERIEKGSHCFFKSSGYDKLELKHKKFGFFFKLKKDMSWCELKYVPLVKQNVMNLKSLS